MIMPNIAIELQDNIDNINQTKYLFLHIQNGDLVDNIAK